MLISWIFDVMNKRDIYTRKWVFMNVLCTCAAVLSSLVYHGEQLFFLLFIIYLLVVPISHFRR